MQTALAVEPKGLFTIQAIIKFIIPVTTTTHLKKSDTMEIDGNLIIKEGHDYLKEALDFPDYYGKNLDALYDCLCEIGVETEIVLINGQGVSKDLIDTFIDASRENELLNFRCETF